VVASSRTSSSSTISCLAERYTSDDLGYKAAGDSGSFSKLVALRYWSRNSPVVNLILFGWRGSFRLGHRRDLHELAGPE
jgi:hypothetical protein